VVPAAEAPFVFLVESHRDPDQQRALLFSEPQRLIQCRNVGDVSRCLADVDAATRSGSYVAGFMAYEAGYGLLPKLAELPVPPSIEHALWFGVFERCQELRGREVDTWLRARRGGSVSRVTDLKLDRSRGEYRSDFERIQAYLHAGDSYQVCQSLRARFRVEGSPAALFERLRAVQRTPYSALLETGDYSVLSLSPELFFRKRGAQVELKPMKGTAASGANPSEDAAIAERMRADPKTRAENVMIVDLLRNDIGRLANPGSVRVPQLFEVERFDQVLQMTSTITAEVDPPLGLSALMHSLFPSGSVTGAPKLRTLQIIHELESSARGIFCGSIGYVTPSGDACFNVAIRSLSVARDGAGVLGIGSGVVVDSQSDAELDECLLKARFLTDAAG
jgi:para-aminobenzoate synthetase/4-amino-4-deoxychorismate lyase